MASTGKPRKRRPTVLSPRRGTQVKRLHVPKGSMSHGGQEFTCSPCDMSPEQQHFVQHTARRAMGIPSRGGIYSMV
jgi:hypothetical protein